MSFRPACSMKPFQGSHGYKGLTVTYVLMLGSCFSTSEMNSSGRLRGVKMNGYSLGKYILN